MRILECSERGRHEEMLPCIKDPPLLSLSLDLTLSNFFQYLFIIDQGQCKFLPELVQCHLLLSLPHEVDKILECVDFGYGK